MSIEPNTYSEPITSNEENLDQSEHNLLKKDLSPKPQKRNIKLLYIAIFIVIIVFAVFKIVGNFRKPPSANAKQTILSPVLSTQQINKEFNFPLTDASGKQIDTIKYVIESIDKRNQILVKGQTATAIDGKIFLIINLKIVNDQKVGVQINSRDYVRLSVNGNTNEWLAPDIHNDPVEVQAISTKYTRVGFAIDSNAKNLILRVGEINGDKQNININ
jgi:hypothetical protein